MPDKHRIKTGLLFGSFNPVHIAHLIIGQYFVQYTGLEQIWFVVTPQNPFKTGEQMLNGRERLRLVGLAIEGNQAFFASGAELDMGTPSYTIHTIRKFQSEHPDRDFVLLIGSDNLGEFDRWKDYEDILARVEVYVYPRPGKQDPPLLNHPGIRMFPAPRVEIASTQIRHALEQGRDPRYLLPEKVLDEIYRLGHYRG